MMRKIKRPELGELVLVTRWSDKNFADPWVIGKVEKICEDKNGTYVTVSGSSRQRQWAHIWRISEDEAKEWMKQYESTPWAQAKRRNKKIADDWG